MDETKDTQANSPGDAGTASKGSEETTPKADTKTYTEDELNKAIQKDRIARGRDAKALELREQDLTKREEAIKTREAAKEAAELAEAQKDPDKLAEYNAKKAKETAERERVKSLDDREAELAKREAEHEAEITAAKEAQKEITIWQVASAKKVDPTKLKELSEELGIEGKEKLERLADEITSGNADTKIISHDSGVTSGGKILPDSAKGKIKAGWEEIHK